MKKKQIIGLVVAAAVFITTGVASVLTNAVSKNIVERTAVEALAGGMEYNPPLEDYIAVVEITGTIQEQTDAGIFGTTEDYQHSTTMDYIDRLMEDDNNKGILLYVDSPGGTVYESEEMYDKLMEYKETTGRPIWDYMTHYGASGAYMISMASDRLYANKNTITGSIGVIMSGYDMSGLYEKLGIRYVSITSGVNKDSSAMTEEQIRIYQSQVDEMYENFVQIVADGRKMETSQVKPLADGRVYTAKQALEHGLIDGIGTYEEMKNEMLETTGAEEIYTPSHEENVFASLFSEVKQILPRSEAQVLKETAAEMESGVFMYYAEQLR